MARTLSLALIASLFAAQAKGYGTEGCKGRKDPYQGNPPAPKQLIKSGKLTDNLVALDESPAGIIVDLKYKTAANFTGKALYPKMAKCWLRPALAQALTRASELLGRGGFGLIVYDCYRPWSVQVQLWTACPKRGLVGDPTRGSHHNRGAAVDLSIFRLKDGVVLKMPSAFDDLSARARHNYPGGSAEERQHRRWLRVTMQRSGLRSIASEWWHYQLPGARRLSLLDFSLNDGDGAQP
jgi:D-alanyl-D-alanine dipeptidase